MIGPVGFQKIEGAAIFLAATAVYFYSGLNIWLYIIFLLVFDGFMIGYLANSKIGAFIYNLGHSFALPCILAVIYLIHPNSVLLGTACLWFAHNGLDRALGYGLKFQSGFKDTHLGKIGR